MRQLADTYWDGLMPTAPSVSTPEASYFIGRFGDATSQTYLAEVRGKAIGFVRTVIDGNKATITDFYVDPDWRRKGVGTSMVRGTLARFDELGVEEVTLTVRRDTPPHSPSGRHRVS